MRLYMFRLTVHFCNLYRQGAKAPGHGFLMLAEFANHVQDSGHVLECIVVPLHARVVVLNLGGRRGELSAQVVDELLVFLGALLLVSHDVLNFAASFHTLSFDFIHSFIDLVDVIADPRRNLKSCSCRLNKRCDHGYCILVLSSLFKALDLLLHLLQFTANIFLCSICRLDHLSSAVLNDTNAILSILR